MKLSEKTHRCPKRGLTRHRSGLFGLFRPYILAKFTLGALLKPLFRQFHGVVRSSPLSRTPVDNEGVSSFAQNTMSSKLRFRAELSEDGAERLELRFRAWVS